MWIFWQFFFQTLAELFRIMKRRLLPNLAEAVSAIITEAGKENMFIREKCEKCLEQIVFSTSGANQKLVSSLTPHIKSKNVFHRVMASKYLILVVSKINPEKCMSTNALASGILHAGATAVSDANSDVRQSGRQILDHLSQSPSFHHTARTILSERDYSKIIEHSNQERSNKCLKIGFTLFHKSSTLPDVSKVKGFRRIRLF